MLSGNNPQSHVIDFIRDTGIVENSDERGRESRIGGVLNRIDLKTRAGIYFPYKIVDGTGLTNNRIICKRDLKVAATGSPVRREACNRKRMNPNLLFDQ